MRSMHLDIQTPEKRIFSGKIESITAKAVDGEIGILPDHAPLATILAKGDLKYHLHGGEEKTFAVDGGFLLVYKNRISALIRT